MVQSSPDQELMSKFGVGSVYVTTQVDSASLNRLAELVDKGVLKPQIDREYPLEQAREAFSYFEQDHPTGKVVLRIR